MKIDHNSEKKIRKFISHSFQFITHLFCEFDYFFFSWRHYKTPVCLPQIVKNLFLILFSIYHKNGRITEGRGGVSLGPNVANIEPDPDSGFKPDLILRTIQSMAWICFPKRQWFSFYQLFYLWFQLFIIIFMKKSYHRGFWSSERKLGIFVPMKTMFGSVIPQLICFL